MARPRSADARPPAVPPRPSSLSAGRIDSSDWPAQAADTVERLVQGVRDKTTGPAISAARWTVAGLVVVLAGTMVAILLAIAFVRALDAYLPSSVFGEDHVWAAHGLVGLPCFGFGLLLLRKRTQRDDA